MDSFRLRLTKSLLRSKLRGVLDQIGVDARKRKSRKILRKLTRLAAFQKTRNIFTYVSLSKEVETRSLIQRALSVKKNVFVPRVDQRRKEVTFFQIYNLSRDLRKGSFGIMEPRIVASRKGVPGPSDLVIVPALGFDRMGMRIGRGGGYFDRFLKKVKGATKIGLAFREQIVKKVPRGAEDVRVDRVITD